jgi:PAS domain-containing protein
MIIEWAENGSPIRAIGTHVDVSRQVKNKQELQLKNELHELILKGSNAGIWDWDLSASNEWWSPKFFSLLGFEYNEHVPSHKF